MSTVVSKNVQIGADGTASNNFTAYQPATPDGTLRIGNGNSGSVTDAITLTSSGNVGIGTTSPNEKLEVATTGFTAIRVSGGDSNSQQIKFYSATQQNAAIYSYYNAGSPYLALINNGSERARIDSSGNVGIGTSSPAHKLDVNGNISLSGAGTSNRYVALLNETDAYAGTFMLQAGGGSAAYGGAVVMYGHSHASYPGSVYIGSSSGSGGSIIFGNGGNAGPSLSERMRIDSSGNVGIGTSSPNSYAGFSTLTLNNTTGGEIDFEKSGTVNGSIYNPSGGDNFAITAANASGSLLLQSGGYNTRVTIDSTGNVGIGTSNPQGRLQVGTPTSAGTISIPDATIQTHAIIASSTNSPALSINYYSTAYGMDFWVGTTGLAPGYIDIRNNEALIFRKNTYSGSPSETMRIDSSGNLLVGDTSNLSNSGIHLKYTGSTNRPISVYGYGGVDGTYVDWLVSAPYSGNSSEQNRIRSSISSNAASSGLQFMISDGGGASTQTQSFRINRTSCTVIGSLSKGSGSFKIDHPLPEKTDTHHLVHSFIEGPQADLIYRGRATLVNGQAQVNIDTASGMTDGTFVLLCRDVQCFTSNETDWTAVRGSVSGNVLTIEAQDPACTATISWMVVGERQDKHMYDTDWTDENGKVIVEPLKEDI